MATQARIELTATDRTRQVFQQVERNFSGLQRSAESVTRLFAGLGGALSAGALVAFARSAISSAAALDDMAEATGASVEGLSKLTDIARIGGADIGTVETALVRLTKALSGTDDESKGAGAAMQALGLDMRRLRDLAPDEALEEVARAFGRFEDGAGKTSAALAIFGKSGAQLLPLLKDIGENLDRSASVTSEQAAQAEKLEKRWNALGVSAANLGRSLVLDLVPGLEKVLSLAAKRDIGMGGALAANLLPQGANIQTKIRELQTELDARLKARETPGSITGGGLLGALAGISDEGLRRRIAGLKELASEQALALAGTAAGNEARLPQLPFIPSSAGSAASGRSGTGPAERFPSDGRFPSLVTGPDSEIALANDLLFEQSEAAAKLAEKFRDLADPIQKYRDELTQIERLEQAGILTQEQASGARFAVNEQIDRTAGLLGDVSKAAKTADSVAQDLGNSLANTFTSVLARGGDVRDLLKAMAIDIANIALIQPAQKAAGNALGAVFSSFNFSSLIPKFAVGTDYVPRDMLAYVHRGEAIIPAAANRPGANGVTVTQSIAIDARGADAGVDARIRSAMAQARDQAVATVKALSDRGGSYARAVGRR